MLELSVLRENKDDVINRLKKRNFDATAQIENILVLDEKRRSSQTQLDSLLHESNSIAKEIGALYKEGKRDEAEGKKKRAAELKEQTSALKEAMQNADTSLKEALLEIPNVPNELVPEGNSDEDNLEVFKNAPEVTLYEGAKPHWDLIKEYDIVDFELGVKVTGAGFPFYKGKGAKLLRALIAYFLDEADKAGYYEVVPPLVVNEASGMSTGQLPDKEGQMYHAAADDLYLIPTAEVPVTNIFRDTLLNEKDFPKKYCAYSQCFRREAGSWGSHVRGLNRLHQFDKVEIVQVEHPDRSYQALEDMKKHAEGLLQSLGLPYRTLRLCGGDLGFTSAITYDFECWSAAQERWLEVSSVSNFETYQANRLKLRFKNKEGKSQLAHTLNGSALALPRIMATILENNQTPEGIKIPEVLVPYTKFDMITK